MDKTDRTQIEIIDDLRELVNTKGYIYSFCNIILHDLLFIPENMHRINYHERISINELSLLLCLWAHNIDIELPFNSESFFEMKHKTYKLLNELHFSFMKIYSHHIDQLTKNDITSNNRDAKTMWKSEGAFVEPIFYGSPDIYDFQYLKNLDNKYKYDKDWIENNCDINIQDILTIVTEIKEIIEMRISNSNHLLLPKHLIEMATESSKDDKGNNNNAKEEKDLFNIEVATYNKFFSGYGFHKYCNDILNLFCFDKSELTKDRQPFFNKFSLTENNCKNCQINGIGDFNIVASRPIIDIKGNIYFVPLTFLLFKSTYESPFYWMMDDMEYKDIASLNRGKVGEEMFYNILAKIFPEDNIYKSMKIKTSKSGTVTDIDVLCVLGNKALIIQIKSKKQTILSKQGSAIQLEKDFKKAIQEAYIQGLKSRECILDHTAKFYDEYDNEIILNKEINDCYIVCGTTEIYSSINLQLKNFLEKDESEPFPIAFSVFDLELITHYLNDPYKFLYYIKQRIILTEFFNFECEIDILGYHLTQNLYKIPGYSFCTISKAYGKIIDRNYYPLMEGIEVSIEGDKLNKLWHNENFDKLLIDIKDCKVPKFTDLIFHLMEKNNKTKEQIINLILKTKSNTMLDKKHHDFSLYPDSKRDIKTGLTYISLSTTDINILNEELLIQCEYRKYKSKSDIWVGLGSLRNSKRMVDLVIYYDTKWEYDEEFENCIRNTHPSSGQMINFLKVGRNKYCKCGSGLKFKHCCGK